MAQATDSELLDFLNQPFATADYIEAVLEVPGLNDIGERLSLAIVRTRDALGGFTAIAELDGVRGIGPRRLERMKTALGAFPRRTEAPARAMRMDPDLPSTPFDLDPDEGRAASHAHMAQHLIAPLQAGAAERALVPDEAGRVAVPAGERLPLVAVAPQQPLPFAVRWRVEARLTVPNRGTQSLKALTFEPFTEAGSFLPLFTPETTGDLAGAFELALVLHVQTEGGRWLVQPDAGVSQHLLVRLIEGNMGRLLFVLGSEKLRLRREAHAILAARSLAQADGGWLDRHGADLGVSRLRGRLRWRDQGGGSIVIEPTAEPELDARYRARLAIYRPFCRRTASMLDRQLNGHSTAGPNQGLPSRVGVTHRLRVVEDTRRPTAAILLVELGSNTRRDNLLAALRRDILIRPEAAADADHAGRPLSNRQHVEVQNLREALRGPVGWTLPIGGAAFAPKLALPLARAGAMLEHLDVPLTERAVLRAQDPAGGSRFELGLGVEIAPIPDARWDGILVALDGPAPESPQLAALLAHLKAIARPRAEDPIGTWFWQGCGFATAHPTDRGLHLSHLNNAGLVVTAGREGAGVRVAAAYDPDPSPMPDRRLQWSLLPIDVARPFALRSIRGGVLVSGEGLAAVIVTDATRHEGTGPYTYRVELPDGALLDLEQYEFLINLLEARNPVGVEINTEAIRSLHVDVDVDGAADPLTVRAARTYRRYRRSPVRNRDNEPETFPGIAEPEA